MTKSAVEEVTDQFLKSSIQGKGVSFQGKSLKLNTEEDCDEVIQAINACKNLEYLNLEGNTLGVDAAKAISKVLETKKELKKALWKDMFTGRLKEEIPKALEYLGNGLTLAGAQLTELDLSDNAFGPIGVKGLASLLSSQSCYQLQELKLNNNGLGKSGGRLLAQALLKCHENSKKEGKALALKLLVVGRNRLENSGAEALAEVFQALGTLEEISMPQNGIYQEGIKALSDSFKNNPNLKVLDLNDNTLTKKGANHIAKALPHMQKLKVLNLGACLLKTSGAFVLASALAQKHCDLEELHLDYNEIDSAGGLAVANAMINKNKLKQLNVNGNHFGSGGRDLLKKNLQKNKRLSTLGTLSDDDSCDEVEDEDNSEDWDSDDGSSEDEKEESNSQPNAQESDIKNFGSPIINQSSDVLSNALDNLSIKIKPTGSLKTFLDNPTPENFLNVGKQEIYTQLKSYQDSSIDFYAEFFIPLLVKISSLSCSNNIIVRNECSELSQALYKDLFDWASNKKQLVMINNILFVYLGLIKCEDKNFKINWDMDGCLSALESAIKANVVPTEVKEAFSCLSKNLSKKNNHLT